MAESKPTLVPVEEVAPIAKPAGFSLDKFKSKHAATPGSVETLQAGLPHHRMAEAKDLIRLHPDEENYWSPELCFVSVPIKGQKTNTLHLIDDDLALQYLPSGKVARFRLALATKPHDTFFLCHPNTQSRQQVQRHYRRGLRAGKNAVGAAKQPQGERHRRLRAHFGPRSSLPP
jgi:hypothetical protein